MIAPLRDPDNSGYETTDTLSSARRAVAAAFFERPERSIAGPPVGNLLAWAFALGAVAVAAAYLACGAWWTHRVD